MTDMADMFGVSGRWVERHLWEWPGLHVVQDDPLLGIRVTVQRKDGTTMEIERSGSGYRGALSPAMGVDPRRAFGYPSRSGRLSELLGWFAEWDPADGIDLFEGLAPTEDE